ncbi:hypothetical protein Lsed01_02225 [Demequina sediminis]|uniref:Flavodoxin-like domain-containing protein n=1 Tax=Demequina sediminis TaxID=1930058 RepID=A0ABP9WKK8_9MICO|nr:hypothetical protein [Demequina sediminis]
MRAVVVYESLWGNTAAVATAIAAGLGDDAVALSTSEATLAVVQSAQVLVAGAPVHGMSLPTEASRESARSKPTTGHQPAPDLSHVPMRAWLETLPAGPRLGAAFDTRVRGPLGRGAARAIARSLEAHGLTLLDGPRGFTVHLRATSEEPAGLLLPGELDAAHQWGQELRERAHARL